MQSPDFADVHVYGDLLARALGNLRRMQSPKYRPPEVFKGDEFTWPGDMEGRTILALVMLARATHRTPAYLDAILSELPSHFNEKRYLGRILAEGTLDEQQLSGHGWLLRGLCEAWEWRRTPALASLVAGIVEGLLLPARGYYAKYPNRPEQRVFEGEAMGSLSQSVTGNWYSSSDIGCAFIMLDGASHAYHLFPRPDLKALLEEMCAAYLDLDLVGISCQTHATLSGLRGLLRFYEDEPRAEYLAGARRVFDLYLSEGITENYANYNWFRRPQWTEPCAIVDSLMVAVTLWRLTRERRYLDVAHDIYFNALSYAQRPNGGFGCDACVGAQGVDLQPTADAFEAWWCCTMRGGEGLARAVEYGVMRDGDAVVLPFFWDEAVRVGLADGEAVLAVRTGYPREGWVSVEVVSSTASTPCEFRFYLPGWSPEARASVRVNGQPSQHAALDGFATVQVAPARGTQIEFRFEVPVLACDTVNLKTIPGHHVFRRGPQLLTHVSNGTPVRIPRDAALRALDDGRVAVEGADLVLEPMRPWLGIDEEVARSDRRQLLFAD